MRGSFEEKNADSGIKSDMSESGVLTSDNKHLGNRRLGLHQSHSLRMRFRAGDDSSGN